MAKRGRVDELNRILHHEMEACETYEGLLDGPAKDPDEWDLFQIGQDHRQAVGLLTAQIRQLGGDPATDPSTLHYWPSLPTGPRLLRLKEDPRTLSTLQEGELLEIEECKKVLGIGKLRDEARDLLERHVMPTLINHVRTLNGYLKTSHQHRA